MRLALNGLILGGAPDFETQLQIARDTGYAGLDVGIMAFEGRDNPREILDRYGVEAAAWGLPVRWQAETAVFNEDLVTLRRLCEVAVAVDCPRCCTWMPPTTPGNPREFRQLMVERFREIAQVMEPYGVRFGLEWIGPWHTRQSGNIVVYTLPDTLNLIEDIDMPNMGLLLDSWHWFMAGGTVCELEALQPEQIVHVHFVDAPDKAYEYQRDDQRAIPGEGIIPLVGFVGALNKIGYTDFGSVEIFGQELPKLPPMEAAAKVKAACDRILAEAAS
jgi:sugar phosphate isomerase/epimerase